MLTYNLPDKYLKINASTLKWIACITMLIDHSALALIYHAILIPNAPLVYGTQLYTLYRIYKVMRGIGRTAFPIYCFFIVEGYLHTRNVKKYALRLLAFGIVSEIPFNYLVTMKARSLEYQNVYFTLLIGLLLIWGWDYLSQKKMELVQIGLAVVMCLAAEYLRTDYGWQGPALILFFFLMNKWRVPQCVLGSAILYNEYPWVLLGYIPMLFYNGERGRQWKYFFYAFYPVHLIILHLIAVNIHYIA